MSKSGAIRVRQDIWEWLTVMAVNCSVKLQMPINQSTVMHAIVNDMRDDLDVKIICEMIKEGND